MSPICRLAAEKSRHIIMIALHHQAILASAVQTRLVLAQLRAPGLAQPMCLLAQIHEANITNAAIVPGRRRTDFEPFLSSTKM